MNTAKDFSGSTLQALQQSLEIYFDGRTEKVRQFVQTELGLKECFEIQKRFIVKDIAKNPANALWAIPYFSIRKVLETCDKLGWDKGLQFFSKIPSSFKTDFQKEIERRIAVGVFGFSDDPSLPSELTKALEQSSLKAGLSEREWQELVSLAHQQVRQAIGEYCAKQNGFTDLVSSGGLLLASEALFHDRSLDIFAIGRKVASLWAKNEATSKFAFGKTLGRAFYSVAPPPPPTSFQVFLTTTAGILILALFSTAVTICSAPLQQKLGFRQRQFETLLETVNAKLLVELTKGIKNKTRSF